MSSNKKFAEKRSPRLVYRSSSSKGWLCMCDLMLAKRQSWRKFLGSLAKLGSWHNWPIRQKSSLDLDVIWTRKLLIWIPTRYHCSAKSCISKLHNRDLWSFVINLAARCHFGPIRNLSRNNQFHRQPSHWLSYFLLLKKRSKPVNILLKF